MCPGWHRTAAPIPPLDESFCISLATPAPGSAERMEAADPHKMRIHMQVVHLGPEPREPGDGHRMGTLTPPPLAALQLPIASRPPRLTVRSGQAHEQGKTDLGRRVAWDEGGHLGRRTREPASIRSARPSGPHADCGEIGSRCERLGLPEITRACSSTPTRLFKHPNPLRVGQVARRGSPRAQRPTPSRRAGEALAAPGLAQQLIQLTGMSASAPDRPVCAPVASRAARVRMRVQAAAPGPPGLPGLPGCSPETLKIVALPPLLPPIHRRRHFSSTGVELAAGCACLLLR